MKKALLFVSMMTVAACAGASGLKPADEEAQPQDPSGATLPETRGGGAASPSAPSSGADAGASPGSDATAPTTPTTPTSDAGPPVQSGACAGGTSEAEPNDTSATATPIAVGKTCATAAPTDTDFFALTLNGTTKLRFETTSEDVEVVLVDETGFFDVPMPTNQNIDVNSQNRKSVFRVTAKTKQSYTIVRE